MKKEYDFSKGKRGPVTPPPQGRTRVFLWLDDASLDWLRSQVSNTGGGDYSDIVNRALKHYIENASGDLAETLRKVLRDEFPKGARRRAASR